MLAMQVYMQLYSQWNETSIYRTAHEARAGSGWGTSRFNLVNHPELFLQYIFLAFSFIFIFLFLDRISFPSHYLMYLCFYVIWVYNVNWHRAFSLKRNMDMNCDLFLHFFCLFLFLYLFLFLDRISFPSLWTMHVPLFSHHLGSKTWTDTPHLFVRIKYPLCFF